jgi:hypothetical protein
MFDLLKKTLRITSDCRFVRVKPSLQAKATLVLVTSIAEKSRANGNVPFRHSPTTNVGNPTALVDILLNYSLNLYKFYDGRN